LYISDIHTFCTFSHRAVYYFPITKALYNVYIPSEAWKPNCNPWKSLVSASSTFSNMTLSILFAAILATAVSAQDLTTSIWLPGAANANQTFHGSVIEQSGDQTVLALKFADAPSTPEYFRSAPDQVTIGGTTFVAYNVSASDTMSPDAVPITIALQCRRPSDGVSAVPTCTMSTLGADQLLNDVCAGLSVESLPAYCTEASAANYEQIETMSGDAQYFVNNYPLIITAGVERLGPSAVAAAKAGSGTAAQATGAAAPMRTMAPALAGLGAAVGAYFL
jgi:hypothetical protein